MTPEWHTAIRRVVRSPGLATLLVALWFLGTAACVVVLVIDPVPGLRHPAVTLSAGLTVAWVLLAWAIMLAAPPAVALARLAWALGVGSLFVDLVLPLRVAHGG